MIYVTILTQRARALRAFVAILRHLRGEAFSHAAGVIFVSNNLEQNKRKVPTGTLPCQNDTKMARFLRGSSLHASKNGGNAKTV